MDNRENNKPKKKSNVVYIDRKKVNEKNNSNKKGAKVGKNSPKIKNTSNAKSAPNVKQIKPGQPKKKPADKKNIDKKPVDKKHSPVDKKHNNKKKTKKGRKINKGRVAIAVVLVLAILFGGFKGIQMLTNKDSKAQTATNETANTENNSNKNDKDTEENSNSKNNQTSSKGQYDMNDEKKERSKKYNIVVDAGHGGNDKGSLDSTETVYEKDVALQIAKKVASRLGRESDVNVVMTRTEDKYVSLEERADIAKRANADALISIHLNAQKKFGDANGLETWYRGGATDGSKELAASVQQTTTSYVEIMSRGILRNNFEILRETTMPAVLVECGFITNVSDMKKLKDPNYQDMLAEGIMQGTLSFLDAKNGKN